MSSPGRREVRMNRFAAFGNDLYTGKRSIDFVGRLRTWLIGSVVILIIVGAGLALRGLNLGIEFTGGSDFRVAGVSNTDGFVQRATEVVRDTGGQDTATVTLVGGDTVRVQTQELDERRTQDVSDGLAQTFGVPTTNVGASVIGPSWGESVSRQALQALAWFLVLVSVMLGLYFRTWKMSFAALVALAHDIVITVGVYAIAGFEITPASMIGFLTILGYSLYDTVVVFDKVRENTTEAMHTGRKTYSEAANLAVNQTLVRSINTSVVALLPVAAILIMGLTVIGPGTLLDLSLALFVGIAVGTYSSIFIATPLLAWLREREPRMKALRERVAGRSDGARPKPAQTLVPAFAGAGSLVSAGRDDPATRVFGSAVAGAIAVKGRVGAATPIDTTALTGQSGFGMEEGLTATGRPIHPSMRVTDTRAPRTGSSRLRRRGPRPSKE